MAASIAAAAALGSNGLRKPSAEILGRIAQGLRISAETLYVQAGILDHREGDESATTAIASDPTLSERQRTTLLQIYAAFQAENLAQAERAEADSSTNLVSDSNDPTKDREETR